MPPVFRPIPDAVAAHYRAGGLDAYGLPPARQISDGDGIPCRHSLRMVPKGAEYLVVAHRPFDGLNPYTETGPIFVAAADTEAGVASDTLPPFLVSPTYIVRGYSTDERIVYGTGNVTPTSDIIAACEALFQREEVAFIHIRSASNNCFHCRVDRG